MGIAEILRRITNIKKIKGSMVITTDGMVVMADMEPDLNTETLAAFCSSVAATISTSLKKIEKDSFSRYILSSDEYKLFIISIDTFILIAVADIDINIAQMNVEIYQAAIMLKKSSRLE